MMSEADVTIVALICTVVGIIFGIIMGVLLCVV